MDFNDKIENVGKMFEMYEVYKKGFHQENENYYNKIAGTVFI